MKYGLAIEAEVTKFVDEINNRLAQGWRLYGNTTVVNFEIYGQRFVQALVHDDGPTNEDIVKAAGMSKLS